MKSTIDVIGGVCGLVALMGGVLRADDWHVCPQQIEADWLRQAEVRLSQPIQRGLQVKPEDDARGGCDGIRTGKWGFHTQCEPNPWWQVDLGTSTAIDRIVLYNRCDTTAKRNSRIKILVSDDGRAFQQVFQHDGKVFFGFTDKKPLSVPLRAVAARYVRLQLEGTSYLHLDEVEVYAVGSPRNVTLNRPATQSSTSQWSEDHAPTKPVVYQPATVVERGLRLAESLRRRGVDTTAGVNELHQIGQRAQGVAVGSDNASRRLYLEACWAVRRMAMRNPLLDFDSILFAKAAPGLFPHMSDQFYGWWSRPGGGIFVLTDFRSTQPKLRCLTSDLPAGSFLRPELSFDGRKVLFAYCRYYPHVADLKDKASKTQVPEDAFYHVFEMNIDGNGRRPLTRGRYDDFDARYLPSGDILFLSTRKGQSLQCTQANTAATTEADLPDSYVRCGGDNYRPVPVFTMHVMNDRGGNMRPVSAFENFEWTPAVANDGRVLYTRWDYIDRFNGHFFSLWSTNPDGTNPQLVYGNYTSRPQVKCEARPIPGSEKLVFTASAHHSILGGSLVLFDRTRGTEGDTPLVRLTPEVPYPETEQNANTYYVNPWPLSEEQYLVAWSDRKLPPHCRVDDTERNPANATGLYLFDAFGNLNLLYRDPLISSACPIPVKRRPRPPSLPDTVAWDGPQEGVVILQDVYQGLTGVPRGSIKSLRVIAVLPKVQPHMNQPNLGVSREDPGKFLLGTVPVEPDGSACFRLPSGMPVLFQAVADDGMAVQTMRSLTYVAPQQTLACVGCHESREAAPPPDGHYPLALLRDPSKLTPGSAGTWPLRYDQLVQPVLDQQCVVCHRPGSNDPKAAQYDLTGGRSYDNLLDYADKDLRKLAFERDRSIINELPARRSKLLALLQAKKGHEGVHLDADGLNRLIVWMDLYAQRLGHYSDQQEEQLRQLRTKLAPLLQP